MQVTTYPTKVMTRKITPEYYHAPYWENDQTMNPVIVRLLTQGTGDDKEFYFVKLPDGTEKWVHLHTLGRWR